LDRTHIYSKRGGGGGRKEGDDGKDNNGYIYIDVIIYSNFLDIELIWLLCLVV